MTDILAILQWAIPSGGIGAAIAWIVHRKVAAAKDASAVHDIYKKMYDDVSAELVKMQNLRENLEQKLNKNLTENDELRRAVNRLRNTLVEIKRCPHYNVCPVRNELQNSTDNATGTDGNCDGKPHTTGQHRNRNNTEDGNSSGRHSDDGDSTGKPPEASGGGDIQHEEGSDKPDSRLRPEDEQGKDKS